jgi:phosphoribosylamine--glycine ligase
LVLLQKLHSHNVPTAKYIETDSLEDAYKFINTLEAPIVVKADGLCGGKGVIIAQSHDEAKTAAGEMLSGNSFGDAGTSIVVEEFLDGYELSVFAICDGKDYVVLPAAQDHKRLLNDDEGPNTGGMGAYAPTPLVNDEIYMYVLVILNVKRSCLYLNHLHLNCFTKQQQLILKMQKLSSMINML